ncbi:unnamed protein product [Paramecium pentaurelia]|uniref:Uncharacterized protein n=1 Tax=Paramecium pentaurelia TaxID=43138 RepID=A0A8S1YE39_9CILI|nr:unnamed protein product [Paramecium pentaurelia]
MGCCKNSLRCSDDLHLEHKGFQISPKSLSMAPVSSNLIKGDTDEIIEQIYCFDNTREQKTLLENLRSNKFTKSNILNLKEDVIIDLRQAQSPSKKQMSNKNLNNKFIKML